MLAYVANLSVSYSLLCGDCFLNHREGGVIIGEVELIVEGW